MSGRAVAEALLAIAIVVAVIATWLSCTAGHIWTR